MTTTKTTNIGLRDLPGMGWRAGVTVACTAGFLIAVIVWITFYSRSYSLLQDAAVLAVMLLIFVGAVGVTWASWGIRQGGGLERASLERKAVLEWMRAWNAVDRDAFLALLAPGFVGKGSMGPQGVDGKVLWGTMMAFRKTFPEIRWELGGWLVSDRDIVVCEVRERGTFSGPWANPAHAIAPTGRSYVCDAVMFFRFDADGLIVENRSWYDSVDWFHQIGVDPNVGAPAGEEPDALSIMRGELRCAR